MLIVKNNGQIQLKIKFGGFLFLPLWNIPQIKKQENKGGVSSLLKMFAMFKIRLSFGDKYLETFYIKCINCKTETGLNSKTNFTWVYDEIVTKFLLNAMLHHVGMSCIISSNREMEYEIN